MYINHKSHICIHTVCIHLYTFVHRDTHAWIIYDHTMYINVHRTHGFLCLLLQRLDTLHNFSWTRTCGTSEPESEVTRHPHDHWITIGIIGESYGSYALFFRKMRFMEYSAITCCGWQSSLNTVLPPCLLILRKWRYFFLLINRFCTPQLDSNLLR